MQAAPRKRVLIVDDDAAVRQFVSLALSATGYEVLATANGAGALEVLRQLSGPPPLAILLDLDMPVLDGAGFARVYRQLPEPHAPLVVISGASDAAERARAIGAAVVLRKPFGVRALLSLLERLAAS